jgi:hypothetical protein
MIQFKKALVASLVQHQKQFYFLLAALNLFALIVYLVIHIGVYGMHFFTPENNVLLKLFFTASCIAIALHAMGIFIILLEKFTVNRTPVFRKWKLTSVLLVILLLCFAACKQSFAVKGVMKDLTTGVKVSYSNMQPEEVVLVMNGEEIHHTDIPLGEQFTLINKNVKGLVQKNGRVSVGAALTITDTGGAVLLNEPDLFKNKESFEASDAQYLKCIISTGKPMKWDERYKVQVQFWDKWGSGKINNELTIYTNGEVSQE